MTEAGSVFSICPSKTNSWAGEPNSKSVNGYKKQTVKVHLGGWAESLVFKVRCTWLEW